jgi:hypothetical protein
MVLLYRAPFEELGDGIFTSSLVFTLMKLGVSLLIRSNPYMPVSNVHLHTREVPADLLNV